MMKQLLRSRFDQWLARRSPSSDQVELSNRNIYILPSRAGWLLITVLFIMLLTAVNYQNSLIFGLCFWLGSVFAILIWHTWKNLAAVQIDLVTEVAGFVGESVLVESKLSAKDDKPRNSLSLRWRQDQDEPPLVDIDASQESTVSLKIKLDKRGWNETPKMEVSTQYPMGILTAWSVIQLNHPVLGYPKPIFNQLPSVSSDAKESEDQVTESIFQSKESGSDFDSLSPYVVGDSLKKVDWKRFAKTEELVTKSFVSPPSSNTWLNFEDFLAMGKEQALSAMAGWVIEWSGQQKEFGLSMPGVTISPSQGNQHRQACLRALALFE